MRKTAILGTLALMVASLFVVFAPASAVTAPLVYNTMGVSGSSVGFLTIPFAVTSAHAIIVVEWIGAAISLPCTYLLTPSDSFSNSYSAIGNCVADANGGATRAFSVSSSSQSGTDSISCNFGSPNIDIEACYAIDVSSPGAITLLASAVGNSARPAVGASSAVPSSLILITAGIQFYCQSVVGGDSGFNQYIPSSTCNSGGGSLTQYGLAGGLENIGAGGYTSTFPLIIGQVSIWSELVVQVAPAASTSTTTSYTATLTGMLVPDTTHLTNSLMLILAPLGGMILCIMPFQYFQKDREIGDKAAYPALFGLLVGSVAADLTVTSQSQSLIPFADLIVAAMLLFLWWWNN